MASVIEIASVSVVCMDTSKSARELAFSHYDKSVVCGSPQLMDGNCALCWPITGADTLTAGDGWGVIIGGRDVDNITGLGGNDVCSQEVACFSLLTVSIPLCCALNTLALANKKSLQHGLRFRLK